MNVSGNPPKGGAPEDLNKMLETTSAGSFTQRGGAALLRGPHKSLSLNPATRLSKHEQAVCFHNVVSVTVQSS